jgi:hypothetical protein
MEGFPDGALLLRLGDRHLFELSPTAHQILTLTDGQHTVAQVAAALAEAFQIPETEVLQDTLSLCEQLAAQGLVERVDSRQEGRPQDEENRTVKETPAASPHYIRNPDVVLREEDETGGLLFNPDTGQVKVINSTGLFIWRQCDGVIGLDRIVDAVLGAFEEAPPDQVAKDAQEFVAGMAESGFIGTVESLGGGD